MTKSGWYIFEDGYEMWAMGLSTREKKVEIAKHGKLIQFIAD